MILFLTRLNNHRLLHTNQLYIIFHIYLLNSKWIFKLNFLTADDDISNFNENDGLWGKYFVCCYLKNYYSLFNRFYSHYN